MKTDKFVVGEVVNSNDHPDIGVHVEIVELLEDRGLRVKLTVVPAFWQQQGLQVGQEHNLDSYTILGKSVWVFEDDSMPSFSLSINTFGKKAFSYIGIYRKE